jgi:hypothetical protein
MRSTPTPTSADDAIAAFDANFVNNPLLGQNTAFVALLNDGGLHVERFNYRAMEGLVLNTADGNDIVATDDVMAEHHDQPRARKRPHPDRAGLHVAAR